MIIQKRKRRKEIELDDELSIPNPIPILKKPKERNESKDDMEDDEDEKQLPLYLNEMVGLLCAKEKFSDVTFIVKKEEKSESRKFPAHKVILAASSAIFEAMLYPPAIPDTNKYSKMDPSARLEIKITGVEPNIFALLLECIYSDRCLVDTENVSSLISMAQRYQVEKLQVLCSEFLSDDLTLDNVLNMFQRAPELLGDTEFGKEFISEHIEDLLETEGFRALSKERLITLLGWDSLAIEELTLFQAVMKWGKEECKRQSKSENDLAEVIKDALPLIRFPTMPLDELAGYVAPMKLIPEQHLLELFTYNSMSDDKVKQNLHVSYPTTPREGGSLTNESKLLEKKYKKDILGFFAPYTRIQFKLLYRGSRDGFTASAFHSNCNNQGPTLTVIKARHKRHIFGGYVSVSWTSCTQYLQAESWIFSLVNNSGKPVKFVPNSLTNAVYDHPTYGPTWGAGHDLHIHNNMQSNSNYSSPSTFTQAASGYAGYLSQDFLAGSYNFEVEEIEVFAATIKK